MDRNETESESPSLELMVQKPHELACLPYASQPDVTDRARKGKHMTARCLTWALAAVLVTALGISLPLVQSSTGGQALAANNVGGSGYTVKLDATQYYYTGSSIKPGAKLYYKGALLAKGVDYKVVYSANKAIGRATVTITGLGSYAGTRTVHFYICRKFSKAKVALVHTTYAHTGKAVKATVKASYGSTKLVSGTNYRLSYANNVKVGTAKLTVTGTGIYKGTRSFTYKIRYSLAKHAKISLARTSLPYTGKARKPAASVKYGSSAKTLKAGTDYTITFKNCTKVGTATVSVKGKGSYGFTLKRTYKITKGGGKIVDLSEWDAGRVTWSKLATHVDAAILRSYVTYTASGHAHKKYGDGRYRADTSYNTFASKCTSNKIAYGAYWYMVVRGSEKNAKKDARIQAKKFWNASFANGHKPLFLVLDVEDNLMKSMGTNVQAATGAAIDELQSLAKEAGYSKGIKIGLYAGNEKYSTFGFNSTAGTKLVNDKVDFVWIPTYGKNLGSVPTKYKPSYPYDMWQYTSKGSVTGVSGNVDISRITTTGPKKHTMGWYLKR